MKDITKFKLRRLAEQMLIILRDDEEVGAELTNITVGKDGYMTVEVHTMGKLMDMSKVPDSNAWKDYSTEDLKTIEAYRCYQCQCAGATAADGSTLCSKCHGIVDADGTACDDFKDYFYSNKVFLDAKEN